jgi:hypothetical protein
MKITEKEFNALTGQETITERDATAKEIADYEKEQAEAQAREEAQAQAEAKRQTALAKLAALGLEEDDIKALGL